MARGASFVGVEEHRGTVPLWLEPGSSSPRAFTLLELLLALAVIAAVASVAIPHLGLLLGDRRLARAGQQVQIEMNRLRVDAMRQGRVLMFAADTGGNTLRIRPFYSVADATEALDQTGSQSALLTGASQGNTIAQPIEQTERLVELPSGVVVESVRVVSAARGSEIEQLTSSDQADGWSRPILFYPDGSTSTAVVMLRHTTYGSIAVKLRGITGEANVGEVTP